MSYVNAIRDYNSKFQVIWDLGRKCTYKCSYCPPHRKNNWSPMASLDELKTSYDFVKEYIDLYDFYRKYDIPKSISFTGGEPTVNPSFFDFIEYARTTSDSSFGFGLTTNGMFSKRKVKLIKDMGLYGTISYHAEASKEQKELVVSNILDLAGEFKINVMFHKDYFQECVDLCEKLDHHGIQYQPRVIGDEDDDEEGVKRGWVHVYTPEQMQWFKDFWGRKKKQKTSTKSGTTQKALGRPCCGGRCFQTQTEGVWEDAKFLQDTNFKGWNCMVNWYFLYLHQELDLVWTHQTCGVNLDSEVAPMGKISEGDKILEDLESKFFKREMPVIRCPKSFCGCGMCINKAESDEDIVRIIDDTTKGLTPILSEQKDNDWRNEKRLAWAFCKQEGVESLLELKP